jgi:hypothetical protein
MVTTGLTLEHFIMRINEVARDTEQESRAFAERNVSISIWDEQLANMATERGTQLYFLHSFLAACRRPDFGALFFIHLIFKWYF